MIDVETLTKDREDLTAGVEKLRAQYTELNRIILMQEGALWYVERLLGMAGNGVENAAGNAVKTEE
jgi:hypothetical protein